MYKLTELFWAPPPFHPVFAALPGRWAMTLGVQVKWLLLVITDHSSLWDVSLSCQDTEKFHHMLRRFRLGNMISNCGKCLVCEGIAFVQMLADSFYWPGEMNLATFDHFLRSLLPHHCLQLIYLLFWPVNNYPLESLPNLEAWMTVLNSAKDCFKGLCVCIIMCWVSSSELVQLCALCMMYSTKITNSITYIRTCTILMKSSIPRILQASNGQPFLAPIPSWKSKDPVWELALKYSAT